MRTLILLACLLSAATAAEQTCAQARTADSTFCTKGGRSQTVSFDPRSRPIQKKTSF